MSRILVVDDQREFVEVLRRVFGALGNEVLTAGDATAGLALFEAGGFDLVIVDFNLPDGTGLEVLTRVRRSSPALPVLVITGGVSDSDRDRLQELGAKVLEKPCHLVDLRREVAAALGTDAAANGQA